MILILRARSGAKNFHYTKFIGQIGIEMKLMSLCHPPNAAQSNWVPLKFSRWNQHDTVRNEGCDSKTSEIWIASDSYSTSQCKSVRWVVTGILDSLFTYLLLYASNFSDLWGNISLETKRTTTHSTQIKVNVITCKIISKRGEISVLTHYFARYQHDTK